MVAKKAMDFRRNCKMHISHVTGPYGQPASITWEENYLQMLGSEA